MARTGRQRQAGFIYLEVLIGIVILAIVAGGVLEGFAATSKQLAASHVEVVASKLATQTLEDARTVPYDDVGTVSGNPPGTLAASQTQTVDGVTYTIQTTVKYVNNPAVGSPTTYVDYKSVVVVVTPGVTGDAPITQSTFIAPPNYASISGLATAVVTVVDADTLKTLSGMTVTISGGPSAARTDVTGSNGTVVFAGLTPNPTTGTTNLDYTVAVAQSGWDTDPTTASSVTTASLAASETWQVTIKVFMPATLNVNLLDSVTGNPITNYSTVQVTEPAPESLTGSLSGNTGSYVFTSLGGDPLEPSASSYGITASADCYASQTVNTPMPVGYPSTTTQTVTFKLVAQAGGTLNVTVTNNSTGAAISGATVQISGGSADLAPVSRTTNSAGQVSFCEPASGTTNYTVAASASGYGAGSASVAIVNNSTSSLAMKLVAGSTGTINLTTPASGTLVQLKATTGTYDVEQDTNSSKTASFVNLAAGTYTAYVQTGTSGGQPTWNAGQSVTAVAGKTETYSLP